MFQPVVGSTVDRPAQGIGGRGGVRREGTDSAAWATASTTSAPGLHALRRSGPFIIVLACAAMVVGWLFLAGTSPAGALPPASAYRATTVIRVDPSAVETPDYVTSLLTHGVVPTRVAARHGLDEDRMLKQVFVANPTDSNWLALEVIQPDPLLARNAADGLSHGVVSYLAAQRVQRRDATVTQLQEAIQLLARDGAGSVDNGAPAREIVTARQNAVRVEANALRDRLRTALASDVSSPAAIERATEVTAWSVGGYAAETPTAVRVAAVGLSAGSIAALMVLLVAVTDRRLRDPATIAVAVGAPLLATLADGTIPAAALRPLLPLLLAGDGPEGAAPTIVTAADEEDADRVVAQLSECLAERDPSVVRAGGGAAEPESRVPLTSDGAAVRRVRRLFGPVGAQAVEPRAPTVVVARGGTSTVADLRQLASLLGRQGAVVVGVVVTGIKPARRIR